MAKQGLWLARRRAGRAVVALEKTMDLGNGGGVSPRKNMAMGKGGSMSCESFPPGASHPDATAKTGEKGAMSESERAVGEGVKRGASEPMGQQAPSHGPLNHSNVAFNRGGKL